MKTYLLFFLLTICGLPQKIIAQLIPGDVNKPINQVYALAAVNYGTRGVPVFTVTPPTTCAGTASLTITWNTNVNGGGTTVRHFEAHGGILYNGTLVTGGSILGTGTLNAGNGYSRTVTGLAPGIYTFGLHIDPFDDIIGNIVGNNPLIHQGDDVAIAGWTAGANDQTRCGVFGVTILSTDNSTRLNTCTISHTNASNCTTADGTIVISGLAPNTGYNTSHLVNGVWTGSVNSTAGGTLTIPSLLTGIYPVRIRRNGETCFRQFNIKVGNNTGVDCFADNQLIDASLGTNLITGGDFGATVVTPASNFAARLPRNTANLLGSGTTDYAPFLFSDSDPQDSRYSITDSTNLRVKGFNPNYDWRLRNWQYASGGTPVNYSQNTHLFACIQRTGDHTGSQNQNNGNTGLNTGQMMLVNANYRNDRVLNISDMNLIAGNNYYFSFWAKNVQPFMPRNKNNRQRLDSTYQPILPRLALAVNDRIYDFAEIPANLEPVNYTGVDTVLSQATWQRYNMRFVSPITTSTANISIYNFQQGGYGNDFAIDDIEFLALSVVGDRVWHDMDRDGIQDTNEPGMANVVVTLLDSVPLASNYRPLQTTVTDAFGYYQFANITPPVAPGNNYRVQFSLPAGYVYTTQNAIGSTAITGSDANVTTGISNTFNLVAGQSNINIDCGLVFDQPLLPASIGNIAWLDVNNNGVQDFGESGLANVTVTLYNNLGAAIRTTVTDAGGFYSFTNVTPGQYRIGITQPTGTICTGKDLGGNPNLDSDLNTSGANIRRTDLFTLAANQQMDSIDIGISLMPSSSSSFGDLCWLDLNNNGLQNTGEPGLPDVKVVLFTPGVDNVQFTADDVRIDSTFTDAFGIWQFTNLTGTRYYVSFALPTGYNYTTLNVGTDESIDSDVNGTGFSPVIFINNTPYGFNYPLLDVGFVTAPPLPNAGTIGNYFWNDIDGDGVQEANEFGVPGITVELLNISSVVIQRTTTNLDGFYRFPYVNPGTYSVRFSNIPPGFQFTARDQGGNANTDSDADLSTGLTPQFTLAATQVMDSVDAGMRQVLNTGNSSIGNVVWYDFDNDGVQDNDEVGAPNISVTLRNAGPDGVMFNLDDITTNTFTNALGQFIFNGLSQGLYRVEILFPSTKFTISPKDAGVNDNKDSDGNLGVLILTNRAAFTDNFRLLFGEDRLNIGFGLQLQASVNAIGNKVWKDNNSNGIQDAGETEGVQAVVVQLLNGAGTALLDSDAGTAGIQPFQTTTNEFGYWAIVDLPNSTSFIPRFALLPPGYAISPHKTGANNVDSDALGTGRTFVITTAAGGGTRNNDIDLGLIPQSAVLGDFVWDDLNGDGLQTAGEPGIGSTTATLYNSSDVALGATVTDASGKYYFPNVVPGSYYLRYTNYPSGMQFTTQESNPFSATGSNVNPSTLRTNIYTIATYGDTFHIDAGLRVLNTANVGNYVWMDTNGNGIQDATERPLSGVVVRLRNAGPNAIVNDGDDFTLGSTITDGAGFYQFIITPTGNDYYLAFSNTPPGSSFTTQNVGGAGASNNSKVNPASGFTPTFNLAYGATNQIQDAGVINITILPIDYEVFTAEKINSTVQLKWQIGNPTEVMRYYVMHSTNGFSFSKIATINSNINLQSPSFLHNNPVVGNNYYRIVAVDLWGQEFQSETKVVKFVKSVTFNIYPNPTSNFINLDIKEGVNLSYRIMDINGKILTQDAIQNTGVTAINVSNLPSGKYFIIINEKNILKYQESFIKK